MSFNEVSVKESPGLCRCCLSEGCYKDLGTEYTWMNENEVYADMLLDCFDIGITQHSDGPNGAKRLICEVCITRLRDACNFKKQVLDSEKKFVDMLGRGEFAPKVVLFPHPMKAETVEEMTIEDVDSTEVEYLDDIDYVPDEEVKEEEEVPAPSSSKKRGRPKKEITDQSPKKQKVKEKTVKVNKGKTEPSTDQNLSAIARNKLTKTDAVTILQSSNVIPFKWLRHNFLCFYCYFTDKSMDLVKKHMITEHKDPNTKSAVFFVRRDEPVKIEISDLKCKLCSTNLLNIEALVDHLKSEHDKIFNKGGNGVVPYRMASDFRCGVCDVSFKYFVKLNQHMNVHFNKYMCDLCGKGFLTSDRLRCHYRFHTSLHKCTECELTFESSYTRNLHAVKVHDKPKFLKCNFCEDTFYDYTARKLHHSRTHGVSIEEFKCDSCEATFIKLSRLNKHIEEVHLKVKNFACHICTMKFFTSTKLNEHLVKHSGLKNFACDACDKRFARKQHLKDHMKLHERKK